MQSNVHRLDKHETNDVRFDENMNLNTELRTMVQKSVAKPKGFTFKSSLALNFTNFFNFTNSPSSFLQYVRS